MSIITEKLNKCNAMYEGTACLVVGRAYRNQHDNTWLNALHQNQYIMPMYVFVSPEILHKYMIIEKCLRSP